MKTYKGFNKDMTCREFQYEEGKEYTTDKAELCKSGFHACEMPLDVFKYYAPSKSIYHEVEQYGDISKDDNDTKISSTKIKIGAKIGIAGIVKAQIDFVLDKIKNSKEKAESEKDIESAATSGDWSSAATSGNWSSAATSGEESSAATSGYQSSAATSGNGSSAATSGEESSAATSNKNGVVLACGKNARAMGVKGSYLVLTEWNEDSTELICAKIERVDGEKIKENTFYTLKNGEFVKVEGNNQE